MSGRVSTLLVVRKEFVFGSRAFACRAIILKGISGFGKKMESSLGGVSIVPEIKPVPTYQHPNCNLKVILLLFLLFQISPKNMHQEPILGGPVT